MKKLIIPTILTATILIAGIFAMMPIEKVQTVHTSILAQAPTPFVITTAGVALNNQQTVATFTCPATATNGCIIYDGLARASTVGNVAAILAVRAVSFNGVCSDGDALFVVPTDDNSQPLIGTGTAFGQAGDLATSATAANNRPLGLNMMLAAAMGGTAPANFGPITLPASGTLAIKFTQNIAQTATPTLTLYGSFTGTTAPAAGALAFSAAAAISNDCAA